MFKRIKSFFKNATFTTIDSNIWRSLGAMIKSPGNWLRWFKLSPRLKAVDKIANDIAAIEIEHQDNKGNFLEESPIIQLLNKPNHLPEFTKQQLIRLTEAHLKLLGEAFWIINRGKAENGIPEEILPIPPTWVKNIPRTESESFYKVITSDGQYINVPKDEMVYFKRLDISEPYDRGQGETQQIGDELQLDEFMSKYQTTFFENGGMPPYIIAAKGVTNDDKNRVENAWHRKFGGNTNAHKPAVIDSDKVSVQVLQQSMKDLDFIASRRFIQDITLEHYMIPKELLGKVENSNRATITQAQKIYEMNALKPDVILIENTLNNQLVPMFKLGGELKFVDYITQDQEFDTKKALDGWNSGLFTRNESRAMMGDDTTKDGDVYKLKLGEILVPQKDGIADTSTVVDEVIIEEVPKSNDLVYIIDRPMMPLKKKL